MKLASSEAKNATPAAASSGVPCLARHIQYRRDLSAESLGDAGIHVASTLIGAQLPAGSSFGGQGIRLLTEGSVVPSRRLRPAAVRDLMPRGP